MDTHTQSLVDTLIVGQGLAGSLAAWHLTQQGETVAVIDENLPVTPSKIAAGMFNPVNTKRFTVAANAEAVIQDALKVYQSIETLLQVELIRRQNIYNVFGNNKEANDLTLKLDHPFFQQYTNDHPVKEAHIIQPYGAFEVGLSGWVDIKKMLASVRSYINANHIYLEEPFDYSLLSYEQNHWDYKHIKARSVVFCEGYTKTRNPFFPELNIIPCKGDVLEFRAPALELTRVVKKGIYIVSLGGDLYKCGSLYKWENDDTDTHQADFDELKRKIEELIDVPFSITAHYTAIRPTTRTRDILVLKHPVFQEMYVINGLGTKGVINGVKAVKNFAALRYAPGNSPG